MNPIPLDCPLCPRLASFREENRKANPDWFNAPVPSFGSLDASLLIVGLAPGLKGANRTGRPFTGDYAGDLLYSSLLQFGFATGTYRREADDGLTLVGCRISNAAHCVPPQNKPLPGEIRNCNSFLRQEIGIMKNLKMILALGAIAHQAVLMAMDKRKSDYPFGHGNVHRLAGSFISLHDSYHCSRYNTQTRRLSESMFHEIFAALKRQISTNR